VIYIQEESKLGTSKILMIVNLAKYNKECTVPHPFSNLFTVSHPFSNLPTVPYSFSDQARNRPLKAIPLSLSEYKIISKHINL